MVEKVLRRFCRHRVAVMLRTLKAENLTLRHDLIDALRRARLYQRNGSDRRELERSIIEGLQSGVT